ncbi:MAG: MFS transporter [Anaerolineae bacterium]
MVVSSSPASPVDDPRVRRRKDLLNTLSFAGEPGFFLIGMSFVSFTTVIPAFVKALTGSDLAVGVATGLSTGVFLLPQLYVASIVARLRRKKPLTVAAVWIGRPLFLVLALAVWLLGARQPLVTFGVLLLCIVLIQAAESVQAVPWLDLLAGCIPPTRRGRVLGAAQIIGGLGGIGAGVAVRHVLGENSPYAFPNNYAFLFAAAGLAMLVSACAMLLIQEPEPKATREQPPSLRQVIGMLPRILVRDRAFLRLACVRMLSDMVGMASAFYVLYGTQWAGLGLAATGYFVVAQVVGSLVAGLLMAVLQDRAGPLAHLRTIVSLSLIPPLLALASAPLQNWLGSWNLYVYMALFFFLGLYAGSSVWPFFNWTLEHAPEADRPLYLGIGNTLGAIAMLAPPLGGWIASRVSYPPVFALAILCGAAALVAASRLPDPRVSHVVASPANSLAGATKADGR